MILLFAGIVSAKQYQENADSTTCRSILCDGSWRLNAGVSFPVNEYMNYTIHHGKISPKWILGIGGSKSEYVIPKVCYTKQKKLILSITSGGEYGSYYYYFRCKDYKNNWNYITHAYGLNWLREEGVLWRR